MSLQIGLRDLDSRVADAARAQIWAVSSPRTARAEDAAVRKVLGKRTLRWARRLFYLVPLGAAAGVGIGALIGDPGAMAGLGFMGAYFTGIVTAVGGVIGAHLSRNASIPAVELRAIASALELGEAETIYLDTVCALLEAGDNVEEMTGRDILETLNELLQHARLVEGRLDRLRKAASTESVKDLREERERLAARLRDARDAGARDDLQQSLLMCDERMRNAEALEPLIERTDAQREKVYQTLLSVQASVSRLQVAPSAVAMPDVEEVKRVVGQIAAQTRAVEEAVKEVVSLRAIP